MSRLVRIPLLIAALALLMGARAALAQDARQDTRQAAHQQDARHHAPGKFDFYVLSLSWSPSFCAAAREYGYAQRARTQCGSRPFSFVVHGLWPQYEHGYPESCERPAPRLSRNIMTSMLDLMPAPRLIYNEWDKHGTCSGLDQRAYFDTVRKARAAIKIPPEFKQLSEAKTIAPAQIESAFVKANPGLDTSDMAVICRRTRLSEVRICLSKDLKFRPCQEIVQHACKRDQVTMPPVRGG